MLVEAKATFSLCKLFVRGQGYCTCIRFAKRNAGIRLAQDAIQILFPEQVKAVQKFVEIASWQCEAGNVEAWLNGRWVWRG